MTNPPFTRLDAASGALFIIIFNLALFDLGAPPKGSDTAGKIASILVHSHSRILGGMYLAGLAVMLGIWFFSTIRGWLTQAMDGRETPLASAAFGGGLFATVLGLLGMILYYGAAYKVAGHGGLSAVRALTDAGNAAIELTKFPLAVFILAVSRTAYRAQLLPRWFTQAGAASALVLLATAIPLFAHGPFTQFGGGLDVIGGVPGVIWILVLSLSLMMIKRAPHDRVYDGQRGPRLTSSR